MENQIGGFGRFFFATGIDEIVLNDNNSTSQWKIFLHLLLDASEKYIPLKTISRHSKLFLEFRINEV